MKDIMDGQVSFNDIRELDIEDLLGREPVTPNELENMELIPVLGWVADASRLKEVFAFWQPDKVFHAAAYKHVPLVEANPVEGIKNNILGTYEVAKAAHIAKVSDFILISTDKAVRPTNVMGATKRGAEQIAQAFSETSETRFSMVRFGNVLGSSGSVVPLFRQQIEMGRALR